MKAKIRVLTFFLVTLFLLLPFGAEARTKSFGSSVMSGKVGSYKVKMQFTVYDNDEVSGWYYYVSKGPKNKISLNGYLRVNDDEYNVSLTESVKGKNTGYFNGIYWTGSGGFDIYWDGYFGTWTSPSGKQLKFELNGES